MAAGLPDPSAVESGEGELRRGHRVQHVAHKLVDDDGGLPPVLQHRPAGDHVLPEIAGIDEVQGHGGRLLLQVEDQRLGVVAIGRGQPLHGPGAGGGLMGDVDEVVGEGSIGEGQLRRRVAKVALAHAAPFEGQIVQTVGVAALVIQDGGTPGDGGLGRQGRAVGDGHRATVVEVFEMAKGGHPKEIGRVGRGQAKNVVVALDHGCTPYDKYSVSHPTGAAPRSAPPPRASACSRSFRCRGWTTRESPAGGALRALLTNSPPR